MSVDIKSRFTAIDDLTWEALTEHRTKHQLQEYGERPKRDALEKDGRRLVDELEVVIRKRLWSDVKVAEAV